MTERYCEGERFADLSFTEETFEDCDFTDCVFVECSFTKCELDHTCLLYTSAFSANRGYVRRILLHQIALFNPFLCAGNTNRPRLLFRVPACFQLENAQ